MYSPKSGGRPSRALAVGLACAGVLTASVSLRAQPLEQLPPDVWRSEYQFTRIGSIRELKAGLVLVADTRDDLLYRLELRNGTSAKLMRKGDGPAEYRELGTLFRLNADSTLLTDGYRPRSFVLEGDSVIATISELQPVVRALGSLVIGADGQGRLLGRLGLVRRGPAPRSADLADSMVLLLGDRRNNRVDTIARLRGVGAAGWAVQSGPNRPSRIITSNPLASRDVATLAPDGWVAVVRSSPYRVDWRSPAGQWRRGPVLETLTSAPSPADKCHAIRSMIPTDETCMPSEWPGWPTTIPPFVTALTATTGPVVLIDGAGNVVVGRTSRAGESQRVYDVVDRRGIRVRRVAIPASAYLVGFGSETAYLVVEDDSELQQLRQHRWTR